MTGIDDWTNQIHTGDATEVLQDMPDDSVHMAMFSPPYWGMRDYGADDQIGLEESLDDFIANLAVIGDELQRVVRDDGNWWLNIGDGYGIQKPDAETSATPDRDPEAKYSTIDADLSDKCKLLMPHRVAIEMVERGWIARNDALWQKTNPMPESVKDRLSTTFELVFHLTPSQTYFYDLDAIRDPYETDHDREPPIGGKKHQDNVNRTYSGNSPKRTGKGKNPGDIFELSTDDYPDGHFAVYPPELVKKPLMATCPEKVCAECGAPHIWWTETDERTLNSYAGWPTTARDEEIIEQWRAPDCDCDTDAHEPGIVLDPMCGRGTTCMVAAEHGRRYVGIELNPEYANLAREFVPDSIQRTLTGYE